MKKLLAFALAMVCVLGLCACNSKKDIPFDDTDVFFAGKVTEVCDNYLLIEVSDMGNTSFSVGTGVEVSLESKTSWPIPAVGDTVNVFYSGKIQETYPVRITEVHRIEIETKVANTHTLEVTENSVGEIGRETFNLSVEITEEDANTLSEIINGGTWMEELTECESDCVINLKGHWAHYNSESGLLNKYNVKDLSVYSSKVQEVSGKSLVLSEEDRATVNAILEKYITLGIESN